MLITIAGQPGVAGSNDSTLTNSTFNIPYGISTDLGGNVYVADFFNDTIRKLVLGPPIPLPRFDGTVVESNVFRTVLSGLVGTNYAVQISADLKNWSTQSTLMMPRSGWSTITSSLTDTNLLQFFRVSVTATNLQNQ